MGEFINVGLFRGSEWIYVNPVQQYRSTQPWRTQGHPWFLQKGTMRLPPPPPPPYAALEQGMLAQGSSHPLRRPLRLGVAHLHTSQGPQVRRLNWCQREPTQPRGTAHRHQPHRHVRPCPLVRPHRPVHPRPHVRPHRHVRPHLYMIHL